MWGSNEGHAWMYLGVVSHVELIGGFFGLTVVSAFKYFIHKFLEVYFDDWTMFVLVRDQT